MDPLLGARYLVTIRDCCVRATFTAVLTEYGGSIMKFDNGVHLEADVESGLGATLEEIR